MTGPSQAVRHNSLFYHPVSKGPVSQMDIGLLHAWQADSPILRIDFADLGKFRRANELNLTVDIGLPEDCRRHFRQTYL